MGNRHCVIILNRSIKNNTKYRKKQYKSTQMQCLSFCIVSSLLKQTFCRFLILQVNTNDKFPVDWCKHWPALREKFRFVD